MPRQCTNYEEAFHYDCALCDEKNCAFRKPPFSRNAFIVFTITLMLMLMGLTYWALA